MRCKICDAMDSFYREPLEDFYCGECTDWVYRATGDLIEEDIYDILEEGDND